MFVFLVLVGLVVEVRRHLKVRDSRTGRVVRENVHVVLLEPNEVGVHSILISRRPPELFVLEGDPDLAMLGKDGVEGTDTIHIGGLSETNSPPARVVKNSATSGSPDELGVEGGYILGTGVTNPLTIDVSKG